jgi:CRP/FNR family cyclic AMP-dependent transcriptional regulator
MQNFEALLANHPFFAGLDPNYIQVIAGLASDAHYNSDTYIFHEGEQAKHFYLIQEGKVALETSAAERGIITIETIEAGEVLGWSWLFPPYRWHFTARVVEPTKVIVLDGAGLRAKSEADHSFGYELVKRVAQITMQRLQATRLQLLDLYSVRG